MAIKEKHNSNTIKKSTINLNIQTNHEKKVIPNQLPKSKRNPKPPIRPNRADRTPPSGPTTASTKSIAAEGGRYKTRQVPRFHRAGARWWGASRKRPSPHRCPRTMRSARTCIYVYIQSRARGDRQARGARVPPLFSPRDSAQVPPYLLRREIVERYTPRARI